MKLTISIALWLRNNFKDISDSALAAKFNTTVPAIKHWRKRLKVFRDNLGMTGKRHSDEFSQQMSRRIKNMWNDPKSKVNSKAHRQVLSDRMFRLNKTRSKENRYSKTKRGYRHDIGNGKIYLRSSWEANYARYLDLKISQGHLYKWEFEPDTFWFEKIKRGVRSYCPDFKIWLTKDSMPFYVEVKGYMDARSKTKIKRMAKYYPDVILNVVEAKTYKNIKNKYSALIKNWE